jgi:hypothetical protein
LKLKITKIALAVATLTGLTGGSAFANISIYEGAHAGTKPSDLRSTWQTRWVAYYQRGIVRFVGHKGAVREAPYDAVRVQYLGSKRIGPTEVRLLNGRWITAES